jgi:hypothetical protein
MCSLFEFENVINRSVLECFIPKLFVPITCVVNFGSLQVSPIPKMHHNKGQGLSSPSGLHTIHASDKRGISLIVN